MDYTKATKAEIIQLLSQKEFEFQETLKEKDKEIAIKSEQLEKEKIKNSKLFSQLDSNVHQKSIDELNEVIKQLREESFEKQRLISKLNSDKENKEYELNQRITSLLIESKEAIKKSELESNALKIQLDGLTDIFNQLYVGLKDQNALFNVFTRNIQHFQERVDFKINSFNAINNKKNEGDINNDN
jgi:hypothetical protein